MNIKQLRADFEAWYADAIWGNEDFKQSLERAYQAGRAALQSQDMRTVIEALETAQNNECGPRRPWGNTDPDSDEYDHDAFMWDYYQRAINHARRAEGGGE